MAREQREAGREVIDQSAGDIDDVGQPLSARSSLPGSSRRG
jgi:hypothetical protein